MFNEVIGKTQGKIVHENLRIWASTKAGRFYRLTWGATIAGFMACEWIRSREASPLLRPLRLIRYDVTVHGPMQWDRHIFLDKPAFEELSIIPSR